MKVDPLEVIILWMKEALPGVGGRIAAMHRYGNGWAYDQIGMSVHLDDGAYDEYAAIQRPRFEVRVYATRTMAIVDIWREMMRALRDFERQEVVVEGGKALVYSIFPESGLSTVYDDVLHLYVGIVFLRALLAEEILS